MTRFSRNNKRVEPRFYSVGEAAQLLGVSAMTLYRAIAEGEFPAVRIRKRLIVPAGFVDELLKAGLETPRGAREVVGDNGRRVDQE